MNSLEIIKYLKTANNLFTYASKVHGGYMNYSVSGLTKLRKAINEIEKTNLFETRIQNLKSSSWYSGYEDQTDIPNTEDRDIKSFISFINLASEGIEEYVNLKSNIDEEYILNIYLPNQYTFSDFASLANELKKGIELPSLDVGGSSKIVSAEPGSIWLVVAFTTSAAIAIVGKIIKIATKANIEIQKGKIFANYAQSLKLENELTQTILEAQKKLVDEIINKEIDEAKKDLDDTDDITKVSRLKLAVKTISELLRREIKFLPSPKMGINVMENFPDEDSPNLIEKEMIKLLSQNQKIQEDK
ncbi:hypothetical protein [Brumimicrobium mesophilum]|uniref:hypothetical protein n=1 Tax=Brumimicrobium mesophilum TaxID=392717 RepID=UPI000D14297D|nr:hypothetical protein [Brumimicrobium mesophilum]